MMSKIIGVIYGIVIVAFIWVLLTAMFGIFSGMAADSAKFFYSQGDYEYAAKLKRRADRWYNIYEFMSFSKND